MPAGQSDGQVQLKEATMTEVYASGNWTAAAGKEDEFLARWLEFEEFSSTANGLRWMAHMQDDTIPRHFVSVLCWESAEIRDTWKQKKDFVDRLMACRDLCEEFYGGDYSPVGQHNRA